MAPRQFRHSLWHIYSVAPGFGHGAHVLQVSLEKSGHLRERGPQVLGQPADHAAAPPVPVLTGQDLPAYAPVQSDQFRVNGPLRPRPGLADPVFQGFQQPCVVLGKCVQPVGCHEPILGRVPLLFVRIRRAPVCGTSSSPCTGWSCVVAGSGPTGFAANTVAGCSAASNRPWPRC